MSNERPGDLKAFWQNQPTEASTMTLKLIRSKARDLQAKTRRQLLGTVAGPLTAVFLYAFGIREFPPLEHVLHPLFAFALVWSLVGLYFVNRGMWSAVMPGDAGLRTGLEFCREEIDRRRRLLRRLLLWSFGPVLLAIATFILALALIGSEAKGLFPNGIPFLALLVIWMFGYFVMRMREQRGLKREIDELNDLETDNHNR
jgi:MFS family permease